MYNSRVKDIFILVYRELLLSVYDENNLKTFKTEKYLSTNLK